MRIGMVGLGRMGGNMAVRLIRHGHEVVAHDPNQDKRDAAAAAGAVPAATVDELVGHLEGRPRVVWLMVPSGPVTEGAIEAVADLLGEGDVIVDGGNSNFRDSRARAEALAGRGIRFLDCGTSGGIWGLERGYCLMVGGEADAFAAVEPALAALAPAEGYAHVGPSGAGHFVKMVHNGIEYGLLAAYGEGFELLRESGFGLDLHQVAGIWRHGSVVRSWLLDLLHDALGRDPDLATVEGYVEDSGEGRWTVLEAIEQRVPAPITAMSLFLRFASRQEDSFAAKTVAALRREFGGHAVKAEEAPAIGSAEATPGGEG